MKARGHSNSGGAQKEAIFARNGLLICTSSFCQFARTLRTWL